MKKCMITQAPTQNLPEPAIRVLKKKNDSEIAGWKASWKSQKDTQWLGPSLLPLHSQRKGRAKSWESRLAHASEVQRKGYQDTKF